MPPRKRVVDPDEDEEVDIKPSKKEKVDPDKTKQAQPKTVEGVGEVHENEQGESYVKLNDFRRITVRQYKGKTLVDIREYYKDKNSGDFKPGAKGVSLNLDQWKVVAGSIDKINDLIAAVKET